jgi:Flp pilus assembly protein TadB
MTAGSSFLVADKLKESTMNRTIRKGGKQISIEDFAFYSGAQDVPADEGLVEIEHNFAQKKSKIEAASVLRQTPFKTTLERNAAIRSQVETAWAEVLARFGNHPPPVFLAYVMGLLGVVALLVDAALTGPSLDALNISEPVVQYISAFAIASLASVTFHLALESFESERMNIRTRWGYRLLAAFSVVGLTCWGILRGYEVAFGADIANNPLGSFLHGHFLLASVVFCFITLGSPLAAAFSVGRAMTQIHDGSRWRRAHREHQQLVDSNTKAQKGLEAELDKTSHELRDLDSERREWQSVFLQYHLRGQERGGREEPLWVVAAKSVGVALVVAVIALPLGALFWPAYLLPIAAGCIAFMHFRRTRFTPSYKKFRRQEATHFTIAASPRPELALPQPRIIDAQLEECNETNTHS